MEQQDDTPKKARRLGRRWRVAGAALGCCLAAYGCYGLSRWWRSTHQHTPPAVIARQLQQTVTTSTDSPDETPVDPDAAYQVPADQPRRILLPSIHTTGLVQRVGIDQHHAVAVPGNVHYAGWYVHSALPGQPGLSIIDGHVQGKYAEGVFKRLGQLHNGTQFQIEFGDKSRRTFRIVQVKTVSAGDADKVLFEELPNLKNQLKLITCGGAYNRTAQAYEQRIIVIATLVS